MGNVRELWLKIFKAVVVQGVGLSFGFIKAIKHDFSWFLAHICTGSKCQFPALYYTNTPRSIKIYVYMYNACEQFSVSA